MADDLPEPLTPPDCDLRGLRFMPLDVVRLVDSDMAALSTGEEFKAAVVLWCKAWLQVPAGSLPNDDRILAHLSGAGARWKKVKEGALRGFVKCNDGRLYHPVVAEKALEALPSRREYKEKKSGETERKQREREARRLLFDQLRAAGVTVEWNAKTSELRDMVAKLVTDDNVTPVTPVTEQVTVKTGTGTGTGTDIKKERVLAAAARGTRLPKDFVLPDGWLDWAMDEKSWTRRDARSEAATFTDYWQAKTGRDATKLDWQATWRNWVRNSRRRPSSEAAGGEFELPIC